MRESQGTQNMEQENRKRKNRLRGGMFLAAALLLAWYLYVLFLSFHPKVTEDYRMRYLEEGYFYEATE